jgi:hypothetical protein
MTPQEFEYIRRAMAALEEGATPMAQIKIKRTMAQILNRSAQLQEDEFCELVDTNIAHNHLVDCLKR